MSTTASTSSTGVYVLTCTSPGTFYDTAPVASGSNDYILNPASGSGGQILAACSSPAWVPYVVPFSFTESDFLVLAPALMGVMAAVAGAKYLINFMRGRR